MITKNKTKTVKDKPMISEKSQDEQVGFFTMLVEEIRYQMKSYGEKLDNFDAKFEAKLDEQKQELKADIHTLQLAVRSNSQDIKSNSENIKSNSQDIKELKNEIQRVEKSLRTEMHEIKK